MNYSTSGYSSSKTASDQLIASLFAAGALFVAGYTLMRTTLVRPAFQPESVAANMVIPHEATLWNADLEEPQI